MTKSIGRFNYDIKYPKRGGGFRIIKRGKWYINQCTPVGEDAELYECMPYGGRRLLDISRMIELTEK